MTTLDEALTAIRGREQAATKGPWEAQDFDEYPGDEGTAILGGGPREMGRHLIAYALTLGDGPGMKNPAVCDADAAFITHARTDVPLLLAALDAVLGLHGPGAIDHRMPGGLLRHRCKGCGRSVDVDDSGPVDTVARPCPTVQTITTALAGGAK